MTEELGLEWTGSPGPVSLFALSSLDPAQLDESALTEAIAGLAACVSWTQALNASFVAELVARRGGLTPDPTCAEDELEPEWEREILGVRLGIGGGSARLLCETSMALVERLPATAAALAAGDLTWQHAVNLARETTELDPEASGRVERSVLADPRVVTPIQVRNRARKLAAELVPAPPEPYVPVGELHAENTGDGGVSIHVTLSADDGRTVATCLDALATKTGPDDDRLIATRRADALVELCRWRLDAGDLPPTRSGVRPHLTLTTDVDQLRRHARGTVSLRGPVIGASEIGVETARRLVCDPGLSVAQVKAGDVVELGREERFPSAAMRRKLEVRDGGCRFPGCARHATRCHAHHVIHWGRRRPDHRGQRPAAVPATSSRGARRRVVAPLRGPRCPVDRPARSALPDATTTRRSVRPRRPAAFLRPELARAHACGSAIGRSGCSSGGDLARRAGLR